MSALTPTDEQLHALDLFQAGEDFVLEAGAGTGKTATLVLLAESTRRRGQYLAFNKSLSVEAQEKFPQNVSASTIHSVAFRAVGRQYAHRLRSARMKSRDVARRLNLSRFELRYGEQRKILADGYLAGLVMRAVERFCQSADEEPGETHVPYVDGIDLPDADGKRRWDNNDALRRHVAPAIAAAWADLQRPDGDLTFKHSAYLKAFQLSRPRLDVDFVLLDEAQDVAPVMDAIFSGQDHAQRVAVGDPNQEIYAWSGAIDAMSRMETGQRARLTTSFRFGSGIASVANGLLARAGSELRLVGAGPSSLVGPLDREDADVVLCRTNATAVQTLLDALRDGKSAHLIGGGADVLAFAKGAADLKRTGWTSHPDLAAFSGWAEVQDYVSNDPGGEDLKLLVDLCDQFGPEVISRALQQAPPEYEADLVVSTAHKAKGREWNAVQLAADFREPGENDLAEVRLLYVAATRAKRYLDAEAVPSVIGKEPVPKKKESVA